jgi:hypothetical protein
VRRSVLGDSPGTVTQNFLEQFKDVLTLMYFPMDLREAERQVRDISGKNR